MDVDATLVRIQAQAAARVVRITDHAREEMEAEAITLAEVLEAIAAGQIIENTLITDVDLVVYCRGRPSRDVPYIWSARQHCLD
jgi:hypothetical protein